MKKFLLILGLALFAGSFACLPVNATVNRDMGYISINTTESKEIAPNVVTIMFGVETTDVDSKRAAERNNQISTNVINAVKKELASDKKATVQTKNFNIRPNYKNNNYEERIIKNYTAINTVQVKTNDISKISTLIDVAVKNNVSNVNSINFLLEDNDAIATELTNKAVAKAKAQAKSIALAANQKIVGVKSLRVSVYQNTSSNGRLYKTSLAAGAMESATLDTATPVETGKIKMNASVDAEFYVK